MPSPQYSPSWSARLRSAAAISGASAFCASSAWARSSSRSSDSVGDCAERGRLAVHGADPGGEHPELLAVEAAHHHLMQRDQERDLLPRHPRRIGHVPRVQRVPRALGADLDLLRAVDEPGEGLVVAGAIDHERPRARRHTVRHQAIGSHRLATPALAADQQRVVGVKLVVEVQQLDRAAGVGERERHAGRRAALGADQRQHVRRVDGRVLAHLRGDVAAERQHRLPQPLLAKRAGVDLAVAG